MSEVHLSETQPVMSTVESGILTITLNRPDKLNALSQEVLEILEQLFLKAQDHHDIKALLITGAGKAFCAGADITHLQSCDASSGYAFARQGQKVFRLLERLGKPSVAAINGYAFGGGCELSMAATIRLASEHAKFAQPEVKLGIIPGYGGTQRLPRLIGKGLAMDLCTTGRIIDATQAVSMGLVSEVTSAEALLPRAHEFIDMLTANGPVAVKNTIDVMDSGYDLSLDDAMKLEALYFAKVCATSDKQEGVNAFLEKRVACFKGES